MIAENVGPADRAGRLAAGIVLLPAGLWLLDGLQGSVVGLVVAVFGLIGLATGATGRCLLYMPLGINTARPTRTAPPTDRPTARSI